MASKNALPAPRRIIASNLPLPRTKAAEPGVEPGVLMAVDVLEPEPILGGSLMRTRVATSKRVPTSNDGLNVPLDDVPGAGIVLPGGLNVYYLDLAPYTEGTMHRTTSTDYLVIVQGTLSLMTPPREPYTVKDGKATYGGPVETLCQPGEVVLQRGMMHAQIVAIGETCKAPTRRNHGGNRLSKQVWVPGWPPSHVLASKSPLQGGRRLGLGQARLASGPAATPNARAPSKADSGLSAPASSFTTAEPAAVNLCLWARRCLHVRSRYYFILGGRLDASLGVHGTPPPPKSTQSRAKARPDTPQAGRSHPPS
ncbi:hypothetical protein DL765_001824 [Monosporascus sp. GIB2]|nr:hypothetical protein DL765_001824 [Monosporascus sp. GIB2]